MTIYIPHPRLLLLAVALLVAGLVAYRALADDGGEVEFGSALPRPGGVELPVVTQADIDAADQAIRASPEIRALIGDREFTIQPMGPLTRDGQKYGFALNIFWDEPLDLDGPWVLPACQYTKTYVSRALWHDVRSLGIHFDLTTNRLVAWGVGAPAYDLGARMEPGTASDADVPSCPPGLDDD